MNTRRLLDRLESLEPPPDVTETLRFTISFVGEHGEIVDELVREVVQTSHSPKRPRRGLPR
jgi:hypothetical protein